MAYNRQWDDNIAPGSQRSVNDRPYSQSLDEEWDDSALGKCKRFFCKNVRVCSCCCCLYILLFIILGCWVAFMIIYYGYIVHLAQPKFKAAYLSLHDYNVTDNSNDPYNPLIEANATIIVETGNSFTMDMKFSDMNYMMYSTDWNNNKVEVAHATSAGKTLTATSTTNVSFSVYTQTYPESVVLPLLLETMPPYSMALGVRGPAKLSLMGFENTVFLDCIWTVNSSNLVGLRNLGPNVTFRKIPILHQDCDFSVKIL